MFYSSAILMGHDIIGRVAVLFLLEVKSVFGRLRLRRPSPNMPIFASKSRFFTLGFKDPHPPRQGEGTGFLSTFQQKSE